VGHELLVMVSLCLCDPVTYGYIAATLLALYILVKIHVLRCVVFDVKELHNAVKKGVGKPLEEAFQIINAELVKKYPAYIRPWASRRFMLFNGGGAMGQMYVKNVLFYFFLPLASIL
jgi:ERG2 and Sigma1 receptor like protein